MKADLQCHWTFQDDNDLKHMAQIVTKYLDEGQIKELVYHRAKFHDKCMVLFEEKKQETGFLIIWMH